MQNQKVLGLPAKIPGQFETFDHSKLEAVNRPLKKALSTDFL